MTTTPTSLPYNTLTISSLLDLLNIPFSSHVVHTFLPLNIFIHFHLNSNTNQHYRGHNFSPFFYTTVKREKNESDTENVLNFICIWFYFVRHQIQTGLFHTSLSFLFSESLFKIDYSSAAAIYFFLSYFYFINLEIYSV